MLVKTRLGLLTSYNSDRDVSGQRAEQPMKHIPLCFSSWLTWPLLSFGDFAASEVPGKRSSPQDQSGLHMGLSNSRGLVGVVEDDNTATGIFIGTSSTTTVCMGQKRVINSSTGAWIKWEEAGGGIALPAHVCVSKRSLDHAFSVWL